MLQVISEHAWADDTSADVACRLSREAAGSPCSECRGALPSRNGRWVGGLSSCSPPRTPGPRGSVTKRDGSPTRRPPAHWTVMHPKSDGAGPTGSRCQRSAHGSRHRGHPGRASRGGPRWLLAGRTASYTSRRTRRSHDRVPTRTVTQAAATGWLTTLCDQLSELKTGPRSVDAEQYDQVRSGLGHVSCRHESADTDAKSM